eukprot:gene25503-biopygen1455
MGGGNGSPGERHTHRRYAAHRPHLCRAPAAPMPRTGRTYAAHRPHLCRAPAAPMSRASPVPSLSSRAHPAAPARLCPPPSPPRGDGAGLHALLQTAGRGGGARRPRPAPGRSAIALGLPYEPIFVSSKHL